MNTADEKADRAAEDDRLEDVASRLLLAALASASTERIDPKKWWVRGRAALVGAAASAESWPHLVSRLGEKLQLDGYTGKSVETLTELARGMDDGRTFRRFRRLVGRDAIYIVAMARVIRERQKTDKQKAAEAAQETTDQLGLFEKKEE